MTRALNRPPTFPSSRRLAPAFAGLAAAALLLAVPAHAATTLYDPALASLPSMQGWLTSGNGPHDQSLDGGRYQVGTLPDEATSFGSARRATVPLDTATGFALDFDVRITAETHSTPNRAGFSFIVTGADPRRSVEIAFWNDRVFAYAYDPADADRFVHGAEALFDTSSASHRYVLAVQNQQFSLTGDGKSLIGGALVDYTAQGAPYTLPNFLFFGDDTSRAASSVDLGVISIGAVPEPASVALWLAGGLGIAVALRRRGMQTKPLDRR